MTAPRRWAPSSSTRPSGIFISSTARTPPCAMASPSAGGLPMGRRGQYHQPHPLAEMDAAARDDRAQARNWPNGKDGQPGGPTNPLGRAGFVSDHQWRRLRLPHPRHAGMVLDRQERLVGLYPHDQPRRDGPVQPRAGWRQGCGAERRWQLSRQAETAATRAEKEKTRACACTCGGRRPRC